MRIKRMERIMEVVISGLIFAWRGTGHYTSATRPCVRGCLLCFALFLGVACGDPRASGGSPDEGQQRFEAVCARCHGLDGKGVPAVRAQLGVPDMTDPAWQAHHTDADIHRTVREGSRGKKMPPLGNLFTD